MECGSLLALSRANVLPLFGLVQLARTEKWELSSRTPRLEERSGQGAYRGAQAGAEGGEESAAAARGIVANVEQLRGNAQRAAERFESMP